VRVEQKDCLIGNYHQHMQFIYWILKKVFLS